jgi:hypothetical protein
VGEGRAELRANWSKAAVKAIRQLDPVRRDRVLAALGAEQLAELRAAGVFDWLPARVHMAILSAVHQLGAAESRQFWRRLIVASFDRSLLKPLIDGGLRLFGRTPLSILRMTPQAWTLVSRRCGVVSVVADRVPGSARMRFDNLSPELRALEWIELCEGQCQGALDFVGMQGRVTSYAEELAQGSVTILTVPNR